MRFFILLGLVSLLAACVRPIEPTPTPGPPTPPPIPTDSPPVAATTFPPAAIQQYLQTQGVIVENLQIYSEVPLGSDLVVGFTFNNGLGQACVGLVQVLAANAQILNGDPRCYAPGTQVLTGTLLFAVSSTNQFYTGAYGHVDPNTAAGATGYAVEYPDGSNRNGQLTNQGFIVLRPDLVTPIRATVMDAGGNQVTQVPFQ